MQTTDWHIFLAVARHGSTLAASRHLQVSQSTVARRIDALEAALGLSLFERRSNGYRLTPVGKALVPRAEAVVRSVAEAITAASQQARGLAGHIRLTTTTSVGHTFMIPAIQEFRRTYPEIQVDLAANEERLDLLSGEADVALRAGPRPIEQGLVAKRVFQDSWALYCSRDYAQRHGAPGDAEALRGHAIINVSLDSYWYRSFAVAHWLDAAVPGTAIVLRHNDIPGLLAALRSGAGVGLMSDMVADSDGTLVRCFRPPHSPEATVWLVTTEHLRREPRIRALLDFLTGFIASGRYRSGALNASGEPAGKVSDL
jgi:DNA-binding transcriptional LysR family regulator